MLKYWRRYQVRRQMRRSTPKSRRLGSVRRRKGLLGWLIGLPSAIGRSIGLAFRTWVDRFSGQRRFLRDLMLSAPALLGMLAVVAATAVGHTRQAASGPRYWGSGRRALASGDAEKAKLFLQKAMMSDSVNRREVTFSLARAYEATGQVARADQLMATLARVGTAGYPPAHRYLAIRTALKVQETKSLDNVESWHWHLSHADQTQSAPLQKSWGMYFLIGGDLKRAAEHFRVAAEEEPALWLQVAELEARMNDVEAVRRTLATARRRLEQQFLRDPGDQQNRLLYATALFYIGELPNAERLLKEGLAREDSQGFRQLLAAVFVRMFDAEFAGGGGGKDGVEKGFGFLGLALSYDPGYQPALIRLVKVARGSKDNLDRARKTMRRLISKGETPAIAHFALGNLEYMAGNQELAKLNMTQAMAMDDSLAVVANNLAFMIAQEEQADLDNALRFADQAVAVAPENPEFLDTRATIYTKMGRLAEAAIDFQKALPKAQDPASIRMRLADLYERMGDREMAEEFRRAIPTDRP